MQGTHRGPTVRLPHYRAVAKPYTIRSGNHLSISGSPGTHLNSETLVFAKESGWGRFTVPEGERAQNWAGAKGAKNYLPARILR